MVLIGIEGLAGFFAVSVCRHIETNLVTILVMNGVLQQALIVDHVTTLSSHDKY